MVYVLCVPISAELESEWRGVTHVIRENKNLSSVLPLHTHWKTTTIFLLTQQINDVEKFEKSFRERLSKINVQQTDLYNFETKSGQVLQKHSCFEKTDQAMKNLAHAMLSLSNCIASNVENLEKIIEKSNTRDYVVSDTSLIKHHRNLFSRFSILKNVHLHLEWISFVRRVSMPHNVIMKR